MPLVSTWRHLQESQDIHSRGAPHPHVCAAMLRLALEKCVVNVDADCASVLRLYRKHGCHVPATEPAIPPF